MNLNLKKRKNYRLTFTMKKKLQKYFFFYLSYYVSSGFTIFMNDVETILSN